MRILAFCVSMLAGVATTAAESWPAALNRMPLGTGPVTLNRTNCAQLILQSFQSNAVVKALVFMPGATDELYFFRRVEATLTRPDPSLLDALVALTNQSPLRVAARGPFLLVHSEEDVLELDIRVQHERTAAKLKAGRPLPHLISFDRDWSQLLGMMKRQVNARLLPGQGSPDSWHFYRHTFAGWNLTPWETLEASALAGKTKFTVLRGVVVFDLDSRVAALPSLDRFPGR